MATDPTTIDKAAPSIAERMYPSTTGPAEPAVEPAKEDAPAALDDGVQDDPAVEPGAEPEPDLPAIAAPMSWAKDARDVFAALPREAQEVISSREIERERFVATKANEAVRARQQVEREATAIMAQRAQEHADQISRYAQMFEPQPPDIRLLQSQDEQQRALYYQLDAEYRSGTAQREQAQREAQEAQSQAEALQAQQEQAELAEQNRILGEQIPEWSEPSARSKLLSDLGSIGGELGYTIEQMKEARASDILALKRASEWKAKADKLDALNRAKMQPVRDAKSLPKVAAPGAAPQQRAARTSLAAQLYPNDVRR